LTFVVVAAALLGAGASPSRGDLASRYQAGQQRANQLRSAIRAESSRIEGYRGSVSQLEGRLSVLQRAVGIQERLLWQVRSDLVAARRRLRWLEGAYAHDKQVLAAELVAEYESPPPTIVNVVVDAHGFDDLLNRMSYIRTIAHRNAQTTALVRDRRRAVAAQTRRLGAIEGRRQRATAAVLVERDQVARLRLSIVGRELAAARARAVNTSRLNSLRRTLAHQAAVLDRQAAIAQASATGGAAVSGSCTNGPLVAHGGPYGFFQGAGTDYSVGVEPILAARLDALGKALQLRLIGISGYRSPAHSVAVGGFADDPHTRGQASDTPGVEGVPEATLERFCLTRPFGGAAEADHIQLL
jgi:hypothetical protein